MEKSSSMSQKNSEKKRAKLSQHLKTTWGKNTTFIKKWYNSIRLAIKTPYVHVRLIHQKLQQIDSDTGTIPYVEFFNWIVELLQYGIIAAIVYFDIFILTGWARWSVFPFALGAIRWLWLDFVKSTTEAIKGQK